MPSAFRSLRNRNAKYFFAGVLVSNVGTWMQFTASAFLLYRLTGKATDLGLNVMFQFLPMLLLGAWAGAIADRHNRRRMTLITQSGLALQSLALGVLDLTGHINIGMVYVLSLTLGLINAFDNPARRGLVTELVDVEDIPNAVALNTAVMTGSRIFGPALAATLVGPLGTGWLFVINGFSFAAILLSIVVMDTSSLRVAPPAPRGGKPVREAMAFIRNDHVLRPLFIVLVIVSTFAFNYSVVLPKLADSRWGSENSFGWLLAVVSVGSLVGSLLTAGRATVSLMWFNSSVFVLAISNIALAWAPNLALAFVFAVPLGIGGAGFIASVNSISQVMSPPDMRGRLLALGAVAFLGSTPVGGPVTGWIADHVSPEWSLGYGGVIALLCCAWMASVMKRQPQSVA
ncbi:MAG: MFS transporter [Ilumatobacteraceae bacterium]|nr:MFS transporter [Ilumatobacteraceae bacterium]